VGTQKVKVDEEKIGVITVKRRERLIEDESSKMR